MSETKPTRPSPQPSQEDASQSQPVDQSTAQDASYNYERSHPEREAGMGRLDNNDSTPTDRRDRSDDAVDNRTDPQRNMVSDDEGTSRAANETSGNDVPAEQSMAAKPMADQPDHSMHEEEPLGWDQAPTDEKDPQRQRHPRTGGKGGTPDEGEPRRKG